MSNDQLTKHERDRFAVSAIGQLSNAQKMAYLMSYFLNLQDKELLELSGFSDMSELRSWQKSR